VFAFGTTTVTCSATDRAGNKGAGTFAVTVKQFTFGGFLPPVAAAPAVNSSKSGSTVALKWKVQGEGGVEITSTSAVRAGWPKQTQVSCADLLAIAGPTEATASGGTALRYDDSGHQFVYNWQAPAQAGTCWRLDVQLADGTTKVAYFKLT
jgi:hypothetical protein